MDLIIFIVYMLVMLGLGVYFLRKKVGLDDYFVGERNIKFWHIGLPILLSLVLPVDAIVFGFRSKFFRFNRIIYRIFVNKLDQYKEEYK